MYIAVGMVDRGLYVLQQTKSFEEAKEAIAKDFRYEYLKIFDEPVSEEMISTFVKEDHPVDVGSESGLCGQNGFAWINDLENETYYDWYIIDTETSKVVS